jgi:hypothetical protein
MPSGALPAGLSVFSIVGRNVEAVTMAIGVGGTGGTGVFERTASRPSAAATPIPVIAIHAHLWPAATGAAAERWREEGCDVFRYLARAALVVEF